MQISGYLLNKRGGSEIYNIPCFCFGRSNFFSQLWGGIFNRYRTEMLVSVVSRVINSMGRHGSWLLVHHHRLGGGDYRCSVGGDRGGLWEPIYGGHTELRISKNVKHNLVQNL